MFGNEESGCKINLYLRVTGRRADGYHTLATCFWPLSEPTDRITVEKSESAGAVEFRSDSESIPGDDRNLAVAAAKRYAEAAGIPPQWRITLEKHLPIAAGVGGGSADAGAVLRILEAEYRLLGAKRLAALALSLGADVPFFLDPMRRPAFARGIGEELHPLTFSPLPLVLAAPGFPVSAKWCYQHLDPAAIGPEEPEIEERFAAALAAGDVRRVAALVRNDLEAALYRKFPQLELIRETMLDAGALAAAVSGSGPTLFAIAADAAGREAVAEALRRRFAGDAIMRIFS